MYVTIDTFLIPLCDTTAAEFLACYASWHLYINFKCTSGKEFWNLFLCYSIIKKI